MPELPEVETICRGLSLYVKGKCISIFEQKRPDLRYPLPHNMKYQLENTVITDIQRRGKYILMFLGENKIWLTHLGMTGRFTVSTKKCENNVYDSHKHDHVIITFSDDSHLIYTDTRRFGYMALFDTYKEMEKYFSDKKLGLDPLKDHFTTNILQDYFSKMRHVSVKTVLLNQSIIAGLGNIYVCEALFLARIHPESPANRIKEDKIERLVESIKHVLREAIKKGGSTLNDFADVQGNAGYFQHNFKVYHRHSHSCSNASCHGTVKRIKQNGRSSFFCSFCQKKV